MKKSVRVLFVGVIVGLLVGWLGLRRHNAELEQKVATSGQGATP
ncbi:MAG: hypothetical protein AB2A00_01495 [Myxococcota bacterium]